MYLSYIFASTFVFHHIYTVGTVSDRSLRNIISQNRLQKRFCTSLLPSSILLSPSPSVGSGPQVVSAKSICKTFTPKKKPCITHIILCLCRTFNNIPILSSNQFSRQRRLSYRVFVRIERELFPKPSQSF